jgi:hypothetical protein
MNADVPDYHVFPNASNFVVKDSTFIYGGFPGGGDSLSNRNRDSSVSKSEGGIRFTVKKPYTHGMMLKLKQTGGKVRLLSFLPTPLMVPVDEVEKN